MTKLTFQYVAVDRATRTSERMTFAEETWDTVPAKGDEISVETAGKGKKPGQLLEGPVDRVIRNKKGIAIVVGAVPKDIEDGG